jgi:hypothetical protein
MHQLSSVFGIEFTLRQSNNLESVRYCGTPITSLNGVGKWKLAIYYP